MGSHPSGLGGVARQRVRRDCVAWIPGVVAGLLGVSATVRVLTGRLALFDTAVTANVYWRLSHGYDDLSTLTGSHHLSDHLSPLYLLLTPFFRLPTTAVLVLAHLLQALSVALVGVAVDRISRHLAVSPPVRGLAVLVSVAAPGAYLVSNYGVREFNLGVGLLAMTMAAVLRDEPVGGRRWAVVTAMTRMEYALGVLLVGAAGRRYSAGRNVLAVGALASVLLVGWLILSPLGGESVGAHMAHLGTTPGEVASAIRGSPGLLFEPLGDMAWVRAVIGWLLPVGLVIPLLKAKWMAPALPSMAIPILGVWPLADAYVEHYWYPILAVGSIAAVVAVARWPKLERPFISLSLAGLLMSWILFFPWQLGWLRPGGVIDRDALLVAEQLSSTDASVSAPSPIVHLSAGRPSVFAFPRPMVCSEGDLGPFEPPVKGPDVVVATDGLLRTLEGESADSRLDDLRGTQVGRYLLIRADSHEALAPCAFG